MAAFLGGLAASAVPGLGAAVPGLGAVLPGLGAAPLTAAGAQEAGKSTVQKLLTDGVSVGWGTLFFLTAFPIFGLGGLNLQAAGSISMMAMKAGLYGLFVLASKMVSVYAPKYWFLSWLLFLNPWFIFDIVQMFSPDFESVGFKTPLFHTPVSENGLEDARVNIVTVGTGVGLFSLGGYNLLQMLPPAVVGAAKPVIEMVFLAVGGITAMMGGGVGAYVLLPQLLSAASSKKQEIATAVAAAPAAPAPAPAAPAPAAPAQKGGASNYTGSAVPALWDIANGLLGPDPRGGPAPYKSGILAGGARGARRAPDMGSTLFLGGLLLAGLGGLSLALLRAKRSPVL